MKKITIAFALTTLVMYLQAQDKFYTKTGNIHFDATAPASPEKIEGINKSVTCVIDTKTGNTQFSVLIKGFQFERALMEEHFNENYLESNKYPKAEFKGMISNNADVIYTREGTYFVKVKGKLSIHGETRDVEADGKLTVKSGRINVVANFSIPFSDYRIMIPALVSDKVAQKAIIEIVCSLEPLK